jgi:hypothetical protein
MADDYNGWRGGWDTWETALILENNQGTYKWIQAWQANFKKKIKSGKFDQAKAESVVAKYLVPVARGKGMAKRFDTAYEKFTGDPEIDPAKVDKAEIVEWILKFGE